ncbi:hypothetical protein ASE86_00545 [Sphingomonas sp. Leaf33]|uniref:DUF2171 domain-containing protein n=1 Tax=Sphingomonas sp. Leaf33 TaxID=1736215 RepID=UPI0006FADC13|nr:DUF2171 domain-containing protein [Sphingomonas sp. Leaf33]KQN24826.1 hypothetical protein ASE86_00545 [Sphingomonas sp. Leaf33]
MAYDRNYDFPNNYDRDQQDYGRDYGSGRDFTYSSAREYRSAGELGGRDDRNFRGGGTGYGGRDSRPDNWGNRESYGAGNRDYYGSNRDQGRDYNRGSYGQQRFGGGNNEWHGSYGHDGHRFTETSDYGRGSYGRDRDWNQHNDRGGNWQGQQSQNRGQNRDYGRAPQGYDYQDRGFMARAGDEVRSWFGDEEAERRREYDQRYDERMGNTNAYGRDDDYHSWRRGQIDALDRDYSEYRRENGKKFENEFGSWRSNRQTQRDSLSKVTEHMEVVGSDGTHVGTVDKVRGDRIILTKTDVAAGGRHHSIPSSWISSVDDKVKITKSSDEAKKQWKDEEESGAMFGDSSATDNRASNRDADDTGTTNLNKSFSGTY